MMSYTSPDMDDPPAVPTDTSQSHHGLLRLMLKVSQNVISGMLFGIIKFNFLKFPVYKIICWKKQFVKFLEIIFSEKKYTLENSILIFPKKVKINFFRRKKGVN